MARTKSQDKTTAKVVAPRTHEAGESLTETMHVACPTCGLMARLVHDPMRQDRRGKVLPSIEGGPYPTYARKQSYGGKGYIRWDSPEPLSDDERVLLTERMTLALARLQAGTLLGVPEVEEAGPAVGEVQPKPTQTRRPTIVRPPTTGPNKAQELIERTRRIGVAARNMKANPDLRLLDKFKLAFDRVWGEVQELQPLVADADRESLKELDEEMDRASLMFNAARDALTKTPIDYKQWNVAMNQLATCCGQKIAPEEEEPEPPAAAAPKPPRTPKAPPAPIKVTWKYADVPGGPVTEHDTPPLSQKGETKAVPAEKKQPAAPKKAKPAAAVPLTADEERAAVLEAHAKLKAMEKPNARSAQAAIGKLQKQNIEVDDAEEALSDYEGLERSDYEDAEEYKEAREEAWDDFLDKLEERGQPEYEDG